MKKALASFALVFSATAFSAPTEDWKSETIDYLYSEPALAGFLIKACVNEDCVTVDRTLVTMSITDTGFLDGFPGLDGGFAIEEAPKTPEPETGKKGGIKEVFKGMIRGIIEGGGIEVKSKLKVETETSTEHADGRKEVQKMKIELEGGGKIGGAVPPTTP